MKKLIIMCLTLCLLSGCSTNNDTKQPKELTKYSAMDFESGFDTYLSLIVWCESQEKFDELFEISTNSFTMYHQLFDIYNNYEGINNLKTINDMAGISEVKVEQEIIDMLLLAKNFSDLSANEFNITMGSVFEVWHDYRTDAEDLFMDTGEFGDLPKDEELSDAAKTIGWEYVTINDENNTVFISNEDVSLDVGGIAKGYAAEMIALKLIERGVTTAIVDAGGNNRIIGEKIDETPWRVGIQHPQGDGSLFTLDLSPNSSVVTSGDYQRFYVAKDLEKYHHIIDPDTLYPATYFRSISIITNNSAIADALSTTLFTMNYEDGIAFVNEFNEQNPENTIEVVWISDLDKQADNLENSFIKDDLYIVYTENLHDCINFK